MAEVVLGAVVVVVVAAYCLARLGRWLGAQWFLGLAARWLAGVSGSDRVPRWKRVLRRGGSALAAVALVTCYLVNPQVTGWVIVCLGCVLLAGGGWWLWLLAWRFRHHRTWLRPLHLAACDVAQIPRGRPPGSWIEVSGDRQRAALALPPGWPADDKDKQRLVAITTAKLGLESPDVAWRLAGPKPTLELTASQPPPLRVSLADIRPAIEAARADEMVWGLGKHARAVTSSLSADSPHIGLSMGSGAGKSVTARALLAQMLYRGCIGLVLDHKMISHQWAAGLPNVAIARRPHEIHAALMWLGREVERRNEVALAGADLDGNVHAVVGPRLIVVGEELNATVAKLRTYWRQIRENSDPVRSPALDALDSASFMGRQVLTNIVYIGQRLSVKASGGDGDARENIGVLAFGRYSASNWKMLAGDHPMPPKSLAPGRIQVVTDRVRETQGAFMSAGEARALATAGEVAVCPAGMPGAVRVAGETPGQIPGPDMPFVPGTGAPVLTIPGQMVTLKEAVEEGMVACSLHAIRKASQRDGSFPRRRGMRGPAAEYDPLQLAEWDAGRR
jgi:hypothetical protein